MFFLVMIGTFVTIVLGYIEMRLRDLNDTLKKGNEIRESARFQIKYLNDTLKERFLK